MHSGNVTIETLRRYLLRRGTTSDRTPHNAAKELLMKVNINISLLSESAFPRTNKAISEVDT